MNGNTVTITKMTRSECIFTCDLAKLFIDKHDPENDFHKEMLQEARWKYSELRDYIRIMDACGKDYIYLREDGGIIEYEIGDLLF